MEVRKTRKRRKVSALLNRDTIYSTHSASFPYKVRGDSFASWSYYLVCDRMRASSKERSRNKEMLKGKCQRENVSS